MKRIPSLLLLLVLLIACGGPMNDFTPTGTKGITVEFADGFPEDTVYERMPIPISLIVKNEGTWTVAPNRFLITWSYDPLYVSNAVDDSFFPLDFVFEGRSEYYPQGDLIHVEEYSFQTNKILGQRESPETDIMANVCYEYVTRLAEGVCLDVDSYLHTGREQVCTGGVVQTNTQGAPVAFQDVEVKVRPQRTDQNFPAMMPEVIATLRNVGSGTVLSPPVEDFEAACGLKLDQTLLNGMSVSGSLLGYKLYCQPAVVKFRSDGLARVRCSFTQDSFNPNEGFSIYGDSCSNPDTFNAMSPLEQWRCIESILAPISSELPGLDGIIGPSVAECYGLDEWSTPGLNNQDCSFLREGNPLILPNNIMTVLSLEARYIYRDSETHKLNILRDDYTETEAFTGNAPIQKGYAYDSSGNVLTNQDGSLMTKCQQYVANPDQAPGDLIELNPEFSCSCTRNECVEMDDFGFCAHSLCPGLQECCDKDAYESFKKAAANSASGEIG